MERRWRCRGLGPLASAGRLVLGKVAACFALEATARGSLDSTRRCVRSREMRRVTRLRRQLPFPSPDGAARECHRGMRLGRLYRLLLRMRGYRLVAGLRRSYCSRHPRQSRGRTRPCRHCSNEPGFCHSRSALGLCKKFPNG